MNRIKRIILMGNPNVGKSVVFSRLTGVKVITSNYPGTTVEFTEGLMHIEHEDVQVIDVPGTYTLEPINKAEEVAVKMLDEFFATEVYTLYKIVEKEEINSLVTKMVIEAPFVTRKCQPGQFIILRVVENGERIPLTIMDYDREKQTVTIIFQVVGLTTGLLNRLEVGDYILDLVGPLGKPSNLEKKERVLGIAGGVGAAPLFPQLKYLAEIGVKVDVVIGGRSMEFVILGNEFAKFCDNVHYVTDDGTKGQKGFVTDILRQLLEAGEKYDEVIAVGPLVMMRAVVGITKPIGLPTAVSLNPIMVDGTGMCGGCRVDIGGETKFACVDGPDFDGFLVDFDEVITRQTYYKAQEKYICRLEGI